MIAFDMDGKVRKPKFELDSEQVRYEHRFAPFNSVITPPPVHYLQFKVSNVKTWSRSCFCKTHLLTSFRHYCHCRKSLKYLKVHVEAYVKVTQSTSFSFVQGKYIGLISY